MTERNDGGPAYLQHYVAQLEAGPTGKPIQILRDYPGMTLRDHFAGQALQGLGNWTPGGEFETVSPPEAVKRRAAWAYAQADAMLVERDR